MAERVDQEAHVDELVRKEAAVVIVELGLQAHRAGGRIDLVVHGQELARLQANLQVAVPGLDGKRGAAADVLQHRLQAVFGEREEDRDRVQLQ